MGKWLTRRDCALLLITLVWAVVGYIHYLPALHAGSPDAYLRDAWRHLRYSDIAFLHFRDHLDRHPIPYVQYQLEYPVLLGATSYVMSFAGGLIWYFSLTYVALVAAALAAVSLLDRLPTVDAAFLALAPGLVFYLGLNWDLAAIALTVIGLQLFPRSPVFGAVFLTGAVWFKFFPIVFLAAIVIDGVRTKAYRQVAVVIAASVATTLAINAVSSQQSGAGV